MEKNLFEGTFEEIIKSHENFTHSYERKVYVLSMTKMLRSPAVPGDQIRQILKQLLEGAIYNLKTQREQESKAVRNQAKREINIPDNFNKKSKKKEEEEGGEEEEKRGALKELSEGDDSNYDTDSEDDDLEDDGLGHSDDDFDDAFDLKVTLDLL